MADTTNLDLLRDLSRQHLQDAAERVRMTTERLHQARQQLTLLQTYRHDYALRAQQTLDRGVSASNYRNFMHFIDTLDNAISVQNKAVSQLDDAVTHARESWLLKKRQLDAYEALATRRALHIRQQEARREQRLSDERALRRHGLPASTPSIATP